MKISTVRSFRKKTIRLHRKGSLYFPVYDIVVVFKDKKFNTGSIIEKVGFFNPNKGDASLVINSESLAFWASQGVHLNKTVKKHLIKFLV